MRTRGIGSRAAAALVLAALSGCAVRPVPIGGPEAPLTVALNLPAPVPPRPEAPIAVATTFSPPPKLPDGRYLTINSNLSQPEIVWHLRSALNVAALGCRGTGGATLVANYNMLLNAQEAALKAAYDATRAQYKTSFGKDWEDQFDANSTRVYNFFSQSFAHDDFCIAATSVAEQAKAVPGPALGTFAQAVLPRLEKPFTDAYRAYDGYRVELAAWNARWAQAQPVAVPTAATAVSTLLAVPASSAPAPSTAAPAAAPRLPYEQVGTTQPVVQPAG